MTGVCSETNLVTQLWTLVIPGTRGFVLPSKSYEEVHAFRAYGL